jgi:hypothetical protein
LKNNQSSPPSSLVCVANRAVALDWKIKRNMKGLITSRCTSGRRVRRFAVAIAEV